MMSFLTALLLSTTITPLSLAIGAYFLLTAPPAENNAISISLLKDSYVKPSNSYSLPLKVNLLPADISEDCRGLSFACPADSTRQ